MIKKVYDIIEKNFMKVNVLNGIRRIQGIFHEKDIECFIAYEDERLVGIVTKKELVGAHSNRIVADVMSDKYICVDHCMYIWEIKEIFDLNKEIDTILVKSQDKVIGYVTRTNLNIELGKHIDCLTGLYKREYIFYNILKLVKSGKYATIMFIDLNNFGCIDKEYGHIVGDEILKSVANILENNLEANSYLCRYAGDEFAIVTPYCIEDSKRIAEKIIKSIESYSYLNNISVSASLGITGYRMQNNKIRDVSELVNKLVNIASLASTKAKKNINNSIIVENMNIDEIA